MTIIEAVREAQRTGKAFSRQGVARRLLRLTDGKKPKLLIDAYDNSAALWVDDILADDWAMLVEP